MKKLTFTGLTALLLALPSSAEDKSNGKLPVPKGLLLDFNATPGFEVEGKNRVKAWHNQIKGNAADAFIKQDKGRKNAGAGRPTHKTKVAAIAGNDTPVFEEQELVNMEEGTFGHLVSGSDYT